MASLACIRQVVVVFLIFNCTSHTIVNAVRPVVLSCDHDGETSGEMNLAKGEQGAPGKRGPVGPLGPRGFKGDKGDEVSIPPALTDRLMTLETQNMPNLQNITLLLQQQQEILEKLEAVHRRDCNDVALQGYTQNGLYYITIDRSFVRVYCDLQTDGGNWLVMQRRFDGSVDFYRNWTEYAAGFGNKSGEFWLGLEKIHQISSKGSYELRVDIEDWEENTAFAMYSTFEVGGSGNYYRLQANGYSGNAGDSLGDHVGESFTTEGLDNDRWEAGNCAVRFQGAWWYHACHHSNLNGRYRNVGPGDATGLDWRTWKNVHYSMKESLMRIRRNS